MKRKLLISFSLVLLLLIIFCNIISCHLKKLTSNLLNDSYRTYGYNIPDEYKDNINEEFYKKICIRDQNKEITSEEFEFSIDCATFKKGHITISYTGRYYAEKEDGTFAYTDIVYGKIKYKMQNWNLKVVDWNESLP